MGTVLENDLFRACVILFGSRVNVTRDFLRYVQQSGVKSAYRKKALLNHPDRHAALDRESRRRKTHLFIETNWAYEQLKTFITDRDNGKSPVFMMDPRHAPRRPEPFRHYQEPRRSGSFFKSKIPQRRLLFGQYLFYSGSVSWESLIKAIVWQRRQRPRFGDIAKKDGLLTDRQIMRLMAGRRVGEPIGEAAVRWRYLKGHQLDDLLSKQRVTQRLFGEYFVINKHLDKSTLNKLYREFMNHNSRFGKFSWERNNPA